jgi:two-component system, NarL family, response regulator DevR
MIRVLIVDDDPFWQEQLRKDLNEESDITVVSSVSNKDEALSLVQEQDVDIVLMDINLTGNNLDGIEATQLIDRLMNKSTKVIMLTSFNDSEIIVESFRKGATNYITKSNYSNLVSLIREVYQGRAALHADIAEAVRTELRLTVLTPMEREVYELRMQGFNNSQIAKKLFKSINTIKSQIKSIRDKVRL